MSHTEFNPTVSFFVDREHPTFFNKRLNKETAAYPTTYEKAQQNKANGIFPQTASQLEHRPLFDVLEFIPKIKHQVKGAEGSMFFFVDDTLVYHSVKDRKERGTAFSIGICGIDLDEMDQDLAEKIHRNFWAYTKVMPQLVSSYISSSKKGIHIIVRCKTGLSEKEYVLEDIIQTAAFIEAVKKTDGIDLTQYVDASSTSMSQRHFLAHCDWVPINREAALVESPEAKECPLKSTEGDPVKLDRVLAAVRSRWNNAKRRDILVGSEVDEMLKELMPEQFTDEFDYELESIEQPEEMYVNYNSRWVVWCTLYKLLGCDKKKFDKEVRKLSEVFARTNPHGDSAEKYYAEAYRSLEQLDKVTSKPMGTMRRLGYVTKNVFMQRVEKKIEEQQEESVNKRKLMVEARKKWISKIQPTETKIKLEGRYIGEKEKHVIESTIPQQKYTTLKAGTGTGKTTIIKKIAKERAAIVLAPFRVLVDEYASDLKRIESEDEYKNDIGCCMTYDRLARMNTSQIRDKWVFVDESHILFMDRTYRDALVVLFNKIYDLVENQNWHVCFVSATPISTEGTHLIEFYQDRPFVRVFPICVQCKDGKHGKRTEAFIKKRVLETGGLDEAYDRIIIFSDNLTRRLYDSMTFRLGDGIGILHADYPEETHKITCDNMLKAKKTVCTSIAYNGLNFNNKDEYIAVIAIVEDTTTAWNIIQQCGRVRNSIVDLFIVWNGSTESERLTVEQRVKLNKLRTELNLTSKELWTKKVEAEKQIEAYIKDNSDIFTILSALISEDYFFVQGQRYLELEDAPKTNPLRKAADEYIKENLGHKLFDPSFCPTAEKKILEKYYRESIRSLLYIYEGGYDIDIMEMKRVFDAASRKSIQSIVAELKHIKQAIGYTADELKSMEEKFKWIAEFSESKDKILLKQIRAQLNEIEKLHDCYIGCASDLEIIDTYCRLQEERSSDEKEKKGEGGKKGVRLRVTFRGETREFATKKEACDWIGVSAKTLERIAAGSGQLSKKCKIEVI